MILRMQSYDDTYQFLINQLRIIYHNSISTHAGPVTPLSNKTSVKNSDTKLTYKTITTYSDIISDNILCTK